MKFEADGFDVQLAANGKLGVAMTETFQPYLILLDLQMPEMDGTEALGIIRKADWGKTIPVIVLTNMGEEEAPKDLKTLGVHGYIVKANLTPREVVEKVKETLKIT